MENKQEISAENRNLSLEWSMTTYRITTQADTRSKSRQSRTWTVKAQSEDDAMHEAKMRHIGIVGWNASVWVEGVEAL